MMRWRGWPCGVPRDDVVGPVAPGQAIGAGGLGAGADVAVGQRKHRRPRAAPGL